MLEEVGWTYCGLGDFFNPRAASSTFFCCAISCVFHLFHGKITMTFSVKYIIPFKVQPESATGIIKYFGYVPHFCCYTPHSCMEPGVIRPGEVVQE